MKLHIFFIVISSFVPFGGAVRNQKSSNKYVQRSKSHANNMLRERALVLINEKKYFPKIISQ